MKSWVLAVSLLAAAVVPAARAADIDDDGPPPNRGAYEDPRYSDIYKFPKAPPRPYAAPPPPYYQDEDDEGPPPHARRYSGAPHGHNCVHSDQVREQLSGMGWRDFHGGQPQGEMVTLRARRPSGRLFELTVHRCTGQIVEARPLEPRPVGPYAFNRPFRDNPDAYDAPPPRGGPHTYDDGPYAYGGPRRWYRNY